MLPPENYKAEQYYFTPETAEKLLCLIRGRTACLCTPTVAMAAEKAGVAIELLDIDERFRALVKEFKAFDILRPFIGQQYQTLIVDPPFFGVSLFHLGRAINALLEWRTDATAYVAYLRRREEEFCRSMRAAGFTVERTSFSLLYQTVENEGKNRIALYKLKRRGVS